MASSPSFAARFACRMSCATSTVMSGEVEWWGGEGGYEL